MKRKAVARVPIPSPKRLVRTRLPSDAENINPVEDASNDSSMHECITSTDSEVSKDSPCTPKCNGAFKQLSVIKDESPAISTSPYLGVELNLSAIKGSKLCDPSQDSSVNKPGADAVKSKVSDVVVVTDGEKTREADSQQTTETENSGVSLNDTYITLSTATSSVSGEPSQSSDAHSHNTCSESEYAYLTDSSVDSVSGSANSRDGFTDQEMEMRKHVLQFCHNRIANMSERSLVPSETDSSLDCDDSLRSEDTSTGRPDGHVTVMKTSLYGTDGEDDTISPSDSSSSSPGQTSTPTAGARRSPDPSPESLTPPGTATSRTHNAKARESMTFLEQACLPDMEKKSRDSESDVADGIDNKNTPGKKTMTKAVDELIKNTVEHERSRDNTEVLTNGDYNGTNKSPLMPEERSEYVRQFGGYEEARDGGEDTAGYTEPVASNFPQKVKPPAEVRIDEEMYHETNGIYGDGESLRPYPSQLGEMTYRRLAAQESAAVYNEVAAAAGASMSPNIDVDAMRMALASELMQTYGGKTPDKPSESGGQFEYGVYGSRHLDESHSHYNTDDRYPPPADADILDTPQQKPVVSDLGFDPRSSSTPDQHRRKSYSPGSSQGSYTYNDIHLHGGNWSAGPGSVGAHSSSHPSDPRLRPQDKHSIYHSPQLAPGPYRDPRHQDSAYYPDTAPLGQGKMATPPHFYKPLPESHEPGYYPRPQPPLDVTRMTFTPRSLMESHLTGSHPQNIPSPYGRADPGPPAPHLAPYMEQRRLSDMDYSSIYPSRDFIERNSGTSLPPIRQPKRYPPKAKRGGKSKTTSKVEKSECSSPDKDKKTFDTRHKYFVVNPSDATNMDPKSLLSKYIDFLILENEQMTEISKSITAPVDIYVTEDMYFMDTLKIRRCFPSKKFVDWSSSFYPKLNVKKMKFAMTGAGGNTGDGERDSRPTQQVLEDVFYFFQREAINLDRHG